MIAASRVFGCPKFGSSARSMVLCGWLERINTTGVAVVSYYLHTANGTLILVARHVICQTDVRIVMFFKVHMLCGLDWVRQMGAPRTRHNFYLVYTDGGSDPVHGPSVCSFLAVVLFP
jgi:hypothetical protein